MIAPKFHHRSQLPFVVHRAMYLFTVAYLRLRHFHHFHQFHFYPACPTLRNDLNKNIREGIQVF